MGKDAFDDLMDGYAGAVRRSRLAEATASANAENIQVTPEQQLELARNRSKHRGRSSLGNRKVPEYKNKTFRISVSADETLARVAAVSGKPFKELLDEAVEYLAQKYKL